MFLVILSPPDRAQLGYELLPCHGEGNTVVLYSVTNTWLRSGEGFVEALKRKQKKQQSSFAICYHVFLYTGANNAAVLLGRAVSTRTV